MSYQVLARKWRPRVFSEMVGQEHVLKALINALDSERLHHAYLFTGTRGVGKTTIARILAKCLNCEQGISSTPCGECSACTSIAEGRFIDLIEVDAASRTKVEDTRELLDNVQYAPTVGRFKVYLIDEVHMLSTHSFNALLKTLEEPPPHVKFLLATTDPQKLPVTILSRCLQFNLKNLGQERIVEHLQHVLAEEQVPCEEAGLWALARAADGSMRDALSLTDQGIAHGDGKLTEAEVGAMLGSINLTAIADIARALVNNDGTEVLSVVQKMSEQAPDYNAALADLLSVWHRVAIAQTVPDALDNRHGDYQLIQELAKALSKEDVQLFYQTVLMGRRDLPLAPDPRTGFEMVMLRMLAFQPVRESRIDPPANSPSDNSSLPEEAAVPVKKPEPARSGIAPEAGNSEVGNTVVGNTVVEETLIGRMAEESTVVDCPVADNSATDSFPHNSGRVNEGDNSGYEEYAALSESKTLSENTDLHEDTEAAHETSTVASPGGEFSGQPTEKLKGEQKEELREKSEPLSDKELLRLSQQVHQHEALILDAVVGEPVVDTMAATEPCAFKELEPNRWIEIYQGLPVGGVLQNIAANLALVEVRGNTLRFDLDIDNSSLYEITHQQRLAEVLTEYFNQPINVDIEVGVVSLETPQACRLRKREERQAAALDSLQHDPSVRRVMDVFGGVLLEKTVKPVD